MIELQKIIIAKTRNDLAISPLEITEMFEEFNTDNVIEFGSRPEKTIGGEKRVQDKPSCYRPKANGKFKLWAEELWARASEIMNNPHGFVIKYHDEDLREPVIRQMELTSRSKKAVRMYQNKLIAFKDIEIAMESLKPYKTKDKDGNVIYFADLRARALIDDRF